METELGPGAETTIEKCGKVAIFKNAWNEELFPQTVWNLEMLVQSELRGKLEPDHQYVTVASSDTSNITHHNIFPENLPFKEIVGKRF